MKVIIHGPLSGRDHLGQMVGFAPDQEVEVDDNDEAAVAWAKGWAATPHATLVEDVAAKPEPAKEPDVPPGDTRTVEDLRVELKARGLPVYGSKQDLLDRLAKAT